MKVRLEPEELTRISEFVEALKKQGKDISAVDYVQIDENSVFCRLREAHRVKRRTQKETMKNG